MPGRTCFVKCSELQWFHGSLVMSAKKSITREDAEVLFERGMRAQSRAGREAGREAMRCYQQAAAVGHVEALLNLGALFRDGRHVRRNLERARQYFEAAARKGSKEAMSCLGRTLLATSRSPFEWRRGLFWLRRAHKLGEVSSAHFLGRAAESTGNWREADKWYRRSLENGDLPSGLRLARHYLAHMNERFHPEGVAVLRRTLQCSDVDPAWAYTELAKCYLQGHGVARSTARASQYLERAAPGDPEARELLKQLRASR